jgi:SAM-dependent methyltransferase
MSDKTKEGAAPTAAPAAVESQRILGAYARRAQAVPAGRYSPLLVSNVLLQHELERRLVRILSARTRGKLDQCRILDVGCGAGRWLRQFIQWGATPENLVGIDLLPDRIAQARHLCPSGVQLDCREASDLGYESRSFDIVFQAMAFSSILSAEVKVTIASEMLRVLRPGGWILWYDFFVNNPRNPDVRGVGKKELRTLFPGCNIHCERATLAPPLGRLVAPLSETAYRILSGLRFARTHYLAVIEKYERKD